MKWKHKLPEEYYRFITHIQDVRLDGNCGFRSIFVSLGGHENDWATIRQHLRLELVQRYALWTAMFARWGGYQVPGVLESLDYFGIGAAPRNKWMDLPSQGILICERYGVVLQVFHPTRGWSTTYFPVFTHPNDLPGHPIISLAFVSGNHYIVLNIAEDAPMPPTHVFWNRMVGDDNVYTNPWVRLYWDRLERGRML